MFLPCSGQKGSGTALKVPVGLGSTGAKCTVNRPVIAKLPVNGRERPGGGSDIKFGRDGLGSVQWLRYQGSGARKDSCCTICMTGDPAVGNKIDTYLRKQEGRVRRRYKVLIPFPDICVSSN